MTASRQLGITRATATALVALLLGSLLALTSAGQARGGIPAGCSLLVSSAANPVPALFITVTVNEMFTLDGSGYAPNSSIQVDFTRNGVFQGSLFTSTDGSGVFQMPVFFNEPADVAGWNVTATDENLCSALVDVNVIPDGPAGTVMAATVLCPPELQTRAQVEAAGLAACDQIALLPADDPTPPGATSNIVTATLAFAMTSSDAFVWDIADAYASGGGFCNPGNTICQFGFTYRWDGVPAGPAELQHVTVPSGYRFGFAQFDGADPASSDPATGTMTFDVAPDGFHTATWYLFANVAPQPSAGDLPDTATARAPYGGNPLVIWIMLAGLTGLSFVAVRSRRRRSSP
jgi:hypothetical protein